MASVFIVKGNSERLELQRLTGWEANREAGIFLKRFKKRVDGKT